MGLPEGKLYHEPFPEFGPDCGLNFEQRLAIRSLVTLKIGILNALAYEHGFDMAKIFFDNPRIPGNMDSVVRNFVEVEVVPLWDIDNFRVSISISLPISPNEDLNFRPHFVPTCCGGREFLSNPHTAIEAPPGTKVEDVIKQILPLVEIAEQIVAEHQAAGGEIHEPWFPEREREPHKHYPIEREEVLEVLSYTSYKTRLQIFDAINSNRLWLSDEANLGKEGSGNPFRDQIRNILRDLVNEGLAEIIEFGELTEQDIKWLAVPYEELEAQHQHRMQVSGGRPLYLYRKKGADNGGKPESFEVEPQLSTVRAFRVIED